MAAADRGRKRLADSGEMLDEVRSGVDDRVYVLRQGDVWLTLPAGSTPLDFATTSTAIGHRCIGAKIGGKVLLPFTYQLQMGDQVEVSLKQPNPSRDEADPKLGYVTTARTLAKFTPGFDNKDRDKNIWLDGRSSTMSWRIWRPA